MAGPGNSAITPFFKSVFLNLLSYYEFMIQQTISQQYFPCWAKKELFVHPAMFPHLPEHLASRYVILSMHVLPWYLMLMPMSKLFWFWPNECSQYIDNIHN